MADRSDQEVFEELHAGNDPDLRTEVRQALYNRGINKINPIALELTLKYEHSKYQPPMPWFEKKNRLHVHLRRSLRAMASAPVEEWPYHAAGMMEKIHGSYTYNPEPKFSAEEIQSQPHPDTFLQALQDGEDPKAVALSICNIWMRKNVYTWTANELGTGILSWDDERNLRWKESRKGRSENLNLCEEISVQPAGIVAIEPFTHDMGDQFDYDLYGTTIAEMTSFVVSFTAKQGIEPGLLRQYVEKAVSEFVEKGAQTFRAPTCRYTNPANAYDRPKKMEKENFWIDGDIAGHLAYSLKEMYPSAIQAYEESYYAEDDDKKKFARSSDHTRWAVEALLDGREPESPLPAEAIEFIKIYQDAAQAEYHTYLADDGNVVLKKTLILNDVLELYKFCDTFLTPCAAVANALQAARFDEQCGSMKSAGDLDSLRNGYKSENVSMTDRLGNLENIPPDQILDKAQNDILVLLGTGESNLHTAFFQVATLAQGTLAGLLPDGTGHYPPLHQIADRSKTGAVVTEDNLLPERMRHMIERMAGRFDVADDTRPLKDRFMQAAKTAAELARHQERIERLCKQYEWDMQSFGRRDGSKDAFSSIVSEMDDDLLAHGRARALDCIKDGLTYYPEEESSASTLILRLLGNAPKPCDDLSDIPHTTPPPKHLDPLGRYMWTRCMAFLQEDRAAQQEPAEKYASYKPSRAVSVRSNLAKWGGEIGLQLPRGFKETSYITRNSHTPFARPGTELPRDLEAFLKDGSDENDKVLQLPDPSLIFSRPKI